MKTKICSRCKIELPTSEFFKYKKNRGGYQAYCKECRRELGRIYQQKNKKRDKKRRLDNKLKCQYGISLKQFTAMLQKQRGVCKICKQPETRIDYRTLKICNLSVDHDHKTGKVRGLLCDKCNRILGIIQDNSTLLITAAEYLKQNIKNNSR